MNNKWRHKRIGDLGRIVTGKTPTSSRPKCFGDEYPFVTPTDMHDKRYAFVTERFLSQEGAESQKTLLIPAGAVCVSCIGWQMGKAIITSRPSFTNQQLHSIIPSSDVNPLFLYYSLSTRREEFLSLGSAGGVRTPIINKSVFSDLKVLIADLSLQRKIAGVLSAYDDLIENNTRRIAILEEMAQAIYREWFMNFRFPGHDKVKLINSPLGKIPEGWCESVLGDHLGALETGKRPKGGATDTEGIPSVGAENIISIGKHNYSSEKFVSHAYFESMTKGIVQDRDVALYKDGAYIGRSTYFRDGFPHRSFCVNEHVFLLRSNGKHITQNMLYLWLQEPNTVAAIRGTNANAAQPGINQKGLSGVKLIAPSSSVAKVFDTEVEPLLHGIATLAKKNRVLRHTRDLLLPKLISGQLNLEEVDIDAGESLVEAEA